MGSHRVGHDRSDLAAAAAGQSWSLELGMPTGMGQLEEGLGERMEGSPVQGRIQCLEGIKIVMSTREQKELHIAKVFLWVTGYSR